MPKRRLNLPALLPIALLAGALLTTAGCGTKRPLMTAAKSDAKPVDPWGKRPVVTPIEQASFPGAKRLIAGAGKDAAQPGVNLVVVERQGSSAVFVKWVIPGGRRLEFPGGDATRWPEGTVDIMAAMLTEGSRSYRGSKLAAALERHGAELSFRVQSDALVATGRVLSHQLDAWLRLAQEAMLRPTFEARPLRNLQTRQVARLKTLGTRPRSIAGRVFNRLVYGAHHPYGSPGPTRDSVGQITAKHLRAAREALVRLGGSTLVVVGDVKADEFAKQLTDVFGDALGTTAPVPKPFPALQPAQAGCHMVDVPKAVQSLLLQGNPAPRRGDATWTRFILANQVLGGSASSRLFAELRERRGLTYGVYSSFDGRQHAGDWSVSTSVRTAKAVEALVALNKEVARMQADAPTVTEIASARRYLIGQFIMAQTSGARVASRLATLSLYGRGEDYWQRWVQRLSGSSPTQLSQAAKQWMGNNQKITLVVGNLAGMRPALDVTCATMILHDARGNVIRHILGADKDMTAADRQQLFASWAKDKAARPALDRYLANVARSPLHRAMALHALLSGPQDASGPQIGEAAEDWPKLAAGLVPLLVAELTLPQTPAQLLRARAAHRWLLDLASPESGSGVLAPDLQTRALTAVSNWAFTDVAADGDPALVKRLVTARLEEADLARLGKPGLAGLEALVSTNVWRTSAAKALIALDSNAGATGLAQGYRRACVIHRAVPTAEDLSLLSQSPDRRVALLLFDIYGLHRLGHRDPKKEPALRQIMSTLRAMIDTLAAQPETKGTAGMAERTVLARDFQALMSHFESLLGSPDPDDRWWAADHIVRYRGEKGLRIVLLGLADDEAYGQSQLADVAATEAFTQFARTRVTPLGAAIVRPLMLAALAGRRRVAKVIAVISLRSMRDVASLAVLRTHNDKTAVDRVLGLKTSLDVAGLARSATAVRRYIERIEKEERAGRLSTAAATAHREEAYRTFTLVGRPLAVTVSRAVNARLGKSPK